MKKIAIILLSFFVVSCANIKRYEKVSVKTGETLIISVGQSVYSVQKSRDLPNVFGRADIYGGKVDLGFSDLRYMGLASDGSLVFQFTDVDKRSNENVFTRYAPKSTTRVNSNTNASASVYGNSVYGNARTTTTASTYERPEATVTTLPPNTTQIIIPRDQKVLNMGKFSVLIKEFSGSSLSYSVQKN